MDNTIAVAILGVLATLITGLFSYKKGKRKTAAETEGIAIDNANKAIQIWKDLNAVYAEEIKELRLKVDDLENDLKTLTENYKEQCSECRYKEFYKENKG